MAQTGSTRRRYRRMTLRIEVEYESAGTTRRDVATTLGAGGLFIATEAPLDEGAILQTRFRLPDSEITHEIAGRVVWNDGKGMGISFADPASGAVLAAELEALIADAEIGALRALGSES